MLLHFGRVAARDKRFSLVIDRIDVKLVAEDGPELGPITVLMLVDRLLVKLIKEPFDSPAVPRLERNSALRGVINQNHYNYDAERVRLVKTQLKLMSGCNCEMKVNFV